MKSSHTFHIPVMGTGFTIDTPARVARFGISSVLSLVDDSLIEDVRRIYCSEYHEPYQPILKFDPDWRAARIQAYLNLLDRIVTRQINAVKASAFSAGSDICRYFELLPDSSSLKTLYQTMLKTNDPVHKEQLQDELRANVKAGPINVNIMTKIDRINYDKACDPLPETFSDALSALRGYAQSTLRSGIVLSAGLNRRLYSYMEEFQDFYADLHGHVKKEIILKVSDYRSAVTQGKFFAKKGLWVSEYRIESGLNCGGHAFAGNGHLMGPILEKISSERSQLSEQLSTLCKEALARKGKPVPQTFTPFRITAQGGIGTAKEDAFLKRYYKIDSTGWGSPFLLVPEVTQVDPDTLAKLLTAKEEDIVLSDVSPLGVPFHTLRESASELNKRLLIATGRPGSPCPLGHLASNTEFTEQPLCLASKQYQSRKLAQLQKLNLPENEYQKQFRQITEKACLCSDLGDTVYSLRQIPKKSGGGIFPAICPGPNIAYFNQTATLDEMAGHIYGRKNLMNDPNRPHMFIKELLLNISFLSNLIEKKNAGTGSKNDADIQEFIENLNGGIQYYLKLIKDITEENPAAIETMRNQLQECRIQLDHLISLSRITLSPDSVVES